MIETHLDRRIIVDAILWNYATVASDFYSSGQDSADYAVGQKNTNPSAENLKVMINRNPLRVSVMRQLGLQIPPSLLTLEPEIVGWEKFKYRLRNRDFKVVFTEWTFDSFLDVFELWGNTGSFSASAITGIKNDILRDFLLTYRETWEPEKKNQYFIELNKKINETYPVTFLYRQNFVYLSSKKADMRVAPENWFKYVRNWHLEVENE